MYRLEYCDDPNNPKLFDGGIEYEDNFEVLKMNLGNIWVFLISMKD